MILPILRFLTGDSLLAEYSEKQYLHLSRMPIKSAWHCLLCFLSLIPLVVLLMVSLNWVYCKFDYASHVKEQFTFDSFNNKHFLESLHHFLNTKLFFIFPFPFPLSDAIHCN